MVRVLFTEEQMKKIRKHLQMTESEDNFTSYLSDKLTNEPDNSQGYEVTVSDKIDKQTADLVTADEVSNIETPNPRWIKRMYGGIAEGLNTKDKKPFMNQAVRTKINDKINSGEVNPEHKKMLKHLADGNVSNEALRQIKHRMKGDSFGANLDKTIERGIKNRSNTETANQVKNGINTPLSATPQKSHHKSDNITSVTYF